MKINYISDLHIEFIKGQPKFEKRFPFKKGELLCIAGDIGSPYHIHYHEFLVYCSQTFKYVVFIAGNHEYYGSSIPETNQLLTNLASTFQNVFFLNDTTHYIEEYNLLIIGTTLWTNVFDLSGDLSGNLSCDLSGYLDFQQIRGMDCSCMDELHEQSKQFLINELEKKPNASVVVMTHHLPSYRMIHENYAVCLHAFLFANHLDFLFDTYKIDAWICGHSHKSMIQKINHTLVVLNPVGYPNENYKININAHFEIKVDL